MSLLFTKTPLNVDCSTGHPLKPLPAALLVFSVTLLSSGCRDTEIQAYEVPRETRNPVATNKPDQMNPGLTWTKPEGWVEKPATDFRVASYAAGPTDRESVDISINVFTSRAGGVLANVNRWRSQLGLRPVEKTDLQETVTPITIAGSSGSFIDLVGTPTNGDETSIVGAIVSIGARTWFFKMTGPKNAVESQRDAFGEIVASAQIEMGHGPEEMP